MQLNELKEKANSLPLSPGVYIMRDDKDNVIYVGKAKKLKNRVSQYFQDTVSHSLKTRHMVHNIHHFDVIVAGSEFEALVLECSLIKQYMPKYNILLKDDKGYPYLRLNMKDAYPMITMVHKIEKDGAEYFGPFGSRGVTASLLETIRSTLNLPNCSKKFPRDIGRDRPCLQFHMKQCTGWCLASKTLTEYRQTIEQARQLLLGNYKAVSDNLRRQMLEASENLNFELAASLRDRLQAVEALGRKQIVTGGGVVDTDVIGFAQTETKACFTVLHFSGGHFVDKDYELLAPQDNTSDAIASLIKQYYLSRGFAPKVILLPAKMEDSILFEELLFQQYAYKTHIKVPQRGDNMRLIEMAALNAKEEAQRATGQDDRRNAVLSMLGKMLGICTPKRIESFDISNISGTDIVASMVVFQDGKSKRGDYKRFKLEGMVDQDDYAAMQQILARRFRHYLNQDKGFSETPDLLLIDGGVAHAQIAQHTLDALGLDFPIFGMVKDDRHRTRALVTADGKEICIETQQSIFSFIGNIQEETHRFAISYHRKLRSKRLRYSELDEISGIGVKRKQQLLKHFKSIKCIKSAELSQLQALLPKDVALAVYERFHKHESGEGSL